MNPKRIIIDVREPLEYQAGHAEPRAYILQVIQ